MKAFSSSLLLAALACAPSFAQSDAPISAKTTTINVFLHGPSNGSCNFEAKSVTNDLSQTYSISGTTGSGSGKPEFGPVNLSKVVDLCSAQMFYAAVSGERFTEVLIVVIPPTASKQSTYAIRLGTAAVTTIATSAQDSKPLLETIAFNFANYTLAEIDAAGNLGVCKGFDLERNSTETSYCNSILSEVTGKYPKEPLPPARPPIID